MANAERQYFMLENVTGVFFWIDKLKSGGKFNQEPHYEVTAVMDRDDPQLKEFAKLVKQVAFAEWDLTEETYRELKLPFKDGTKLADKAPKHDREWARGKVVLDFKTSADYPPTIGVYDAKGRFAELTNLQQSLIRSAFYPGVKVNVDIAISTFDSRDQGITLYLQGIGSHQKGDRIPGLGNSGSFNRLSRHMGTVSDENPMAGMADIYDEIPL